MRKKIIFIIPTITRTGGAERVCVNLANFLQKRGYQVFIQVLQNVNKVTYPVDEGVKIFSAPSLRFGVHAAAFQCLFRYFFRRAKPDCIIAFLESANVIASIIARFTNIRVILTERANPAKDPRNPKSTARIRAYLPHVAKFVMQTERCAERFTDYLPVKPEQLEVIYNPVKNNLPVKLEKMTTIYNPVKCNEYVNECQTEKDMLLAVGRLYYQKGYDRLIRIFSAIHKIFPEKKLYICGDGPAKNRIKALMKKYSVEDSVFLLGNIENVAEYYRKAEVFLMTSHYEGIPNAMLEAYANGCPAISFDFDYGASDIITHNRNGLLIPQDDEKAFVEALIKYLRDPGMRAEFVRNIPESIKKFSPEVIVDQWEEVIHG